MISLPAIRTRLRGPFPTDRCFSPGSGRSGWCFGCRVSVVALAVCLAAGTARGEAVFSVRFDADPFAAGWSAAGEALWRNQGAFADDPELFVAAQSAVMTPAFPLRAGGWYRVEFHLGEEGEAESAFTDAGALWVARFRASGNGPVLTKSIRSTLERQPGAETLRSLHFRVPVDSVAAPGDPLDCFFSIEALPGGALAVDDFSVYEADPAAVLADWKAQVGQLKARPGWIPGGVRLAPLERTRGNLASGEPLTLVVLGDVALVDSFNGPIGLALGESFPGSRVEIVTPVYSRDLPAGAGVDYEAMIFNHEPSLVVIGATVLPVPLSDYRQLIEVIRDHDQLMGRRTDILLVTRPLSPVVSGFFFEPDMRPLDAESDESDLEAAEGIRADLWQLATGYGAAFFDLEGVMGEFLYGPAVAAGVGPPEGPFEAGPYAYWLRNSSHGSARAQALQAALWTEFLSFETFALWLGRALRDVEGETLGHSGNGPAAALLGHDDDPDRDGLSLLTEYACGLDPFVRDHRVFDPANPQKGGLPRVSLDAESGVFQVDYLRRREHPVTGPVYRPAFHREGVRPASPQPGEGGSSVGVTPLNARWERVTRRWDPAVEAVDESGAARRFFSLRIEPSEESAR